MGSHWRRGDRVTWTTVLTASAIGVVLGLTVSAFGITWFFYAACGAVVAGSVAAFLTSRQRRDNSFEAVKPRPLAGSTHH